ncbi:hypothetical protein M3Y94_00237200 [Aphelenchoides besseyi]|nr:hypothetical protein M3Y94_00237200 [Aphelenchoides besseyi]KAI6236383.1 hypothetical protein M3Y95_00151800 [Aphelenchoides besseyi]
MGDSNGGDISSLKIPVHWLNGRRFLREDSGRKNSEGIVLTPTILFDPKGSYEHCYTWSRYGPIRSGAAVFGCTGCRKIRDAHRKQLKGQKMEKRVVPTILVDLTNGQEPFFKRLILPTHKHFCSIQKTAEFQISSIPRSQLNSLNGRANVVGNRELLEPFVRRLHDTCDKSKVQTEDSIRRPSINVQKAEMRRTHRRKQPMPMKLPSSSTPSPTVDEPSPPMDTQLAMLQRLVGFLNSIPQ